jgi:hypothetical protein
LRQYCGRVSAVGKSLNKVIQVQVSDTTMLNNVPPVVPKKNMRAVHCADKADSVWKVLGFPVVFRQIKYSA